MTQILHRVFVENVNSRRLAQEAEQATKVASQAANETIKRMNTELEAYVQRLVDSRNIIVHRHRP